MVSLVVPRSTLLGPKALARIAITLLPLGPWALGGCADLIGLEDLGSASGVGLGGAGGGSTGGGSGDSSGGNGSGGENPGAGGSSSGGTTSGTGGRSTDGSGGGGGSGGSAGDGGSGGAGGEGGGTPGCAIDLTQEITDDFTDEAYTEACWTSYNTQLLAGGNWQQDPTAGGTLSGVPNRANAWFNGDTAPLLYQPVSGSFLVEATVSVREPGGEERPPNHIYASAGLLVIPAGATFTDGSFVDYYAIKAGTHTPATEIGLKGEFTTLPGAPTATRLQRWPFDNAWNQSRIRVCRVDDRLWTGYWNGSAWTGAHSNATYNEHGYPLDDTEDELPQLEDEVWVGLGAEAFTASINDSPENALIIFHEVTFKRVAQLADCRL